MDSIFKIYTDGGARGNPGPAASAFVVVKKGIVVEKGSKFLGRATNNEAEYNAVILALHWLVTNKNNLSSSKIQFILDSELVVRQLTGVYKVKSKNLKTLIVKTRNLIDILGDVEINFTSIKREKNKLADSLVNKVLDENLI